MDAYFRPRSLDEALTLLATTPGCQVLAGGTDVFPARAGAEAWMRRDDRPLLDISGVAGLGAVTQAGAAWRIGALVTWAQFRATPLPPCFDGLKQAARQIGEAQVQNRGTLLGNLCNASPAADGVPPLLTLDAEVELAGPEGSRRLPLDRFILGNRRSALAPAELAVALHVAVPARESRSGFLKLGARSHLVISITSAAAALWVREGRIERAALAVGACSAVPLRLPLAEAALSGARPGAEAACLLCADHLAGLAPIEDVRASAAYRQDAALVLLRRLVESLA